MRVLGLQTHSLLAVLGCFELFAEFWGVRKNAFKMLSCNWGTGKTLQADLHDARA